MFISLYSSVFAGCVLAGNSAVSEEFRKAAGNLPSDGEPHVQKKQVPIPVWIMGNDEESCRYFRQADRVPLNTPSGMESACFSRILTR